MNTQTSGTRFRLFAALTALGAAAALFPASALATAGGDRQSAKSLKPTCNMVTDSTRDELNATGQYDPSLDITSADVATNKTMLTAVIRVAKLSTGFDATAPFGRMWSLLMAVPGASAGQVVVSGEDGPFGVRDAQGLGGKVTLDTKTNSILVTEKLSTLASSFKAHIVYRKTRLTQLYASAGAVVEEPDAGGLSNLDFQEVGGHDGAPNSGSSPASYLAGAPSCVKVGS